MAFNKILTKLSEGDKILPYFELGLLSESWPDHYNIKVDSRPYYGKGDGYFHPSTHSLMGARQLYFRMHPGFRDTMIHKPFTLDQQMIFATGSALHAVVQTQMQMVGLVKSEDDIELEYILKEQHVRGRNDFRVTHPDGNEYLVEMKTMDPWLYKNLKEPKIEWDAQLSMAEYAYGHTGGIILVMERGGACHMREFKHRRNDFLLEQIFEKFAYVRQCIKDNEPPRHCCALDSDEMKSCPARFQCWLKEDDDELHDEVH
jgi:hypothetical protein